MSISNAPTVDLIDGFTGPSSTNELSTTPFWALAVFQLAVPLTYSRKTQTSVTDTPADGAMLRGDPLVITGDCVSLSVSSSKSSHTKSLSASLKQSDHNYLVEILPGDWIVAWIGPYEDRFLGKGGILYRIRAGTACNEYRDGLRFVGRVQSIRKVVARDPDGSLSVDYSIQAQSFTELNTSVFYDQGLAETAKNQIGTWMTKIGLEIDQIFGESKNGEGRGSLEDNVHKVIPSLVEILLGRGLPSEINPGGKGALQAATGPIGPSGNDPKESPFAYLVPRRICQLLGKSTNPSKAGGVLSYADIMTMVFGVQFFENSNDDSQPWTKMQPTIEENSPYTTANHLYTGHPMLGALLPYMFETTNTPLWNILEQFLNPTVNEMFTCMRSNKDGNVVPTLVIRQIPFTTANFTNTSIDTTEFLELPRWKMDPAILTSLNIGRTDATRVNFVHIYGQNGYEKGFSISQQLSKNEPIRDDADIYRSGLRMYQTTVNCDAVNQAGKAPRVWMELVADRLMGSQLTLNGTMVCIGIGDPICEGDNLEFDGVVYHIESVDHSGRIDGASGRRQFTTSLTLSNGLRAETDVQEPNSASSDPNTYSNEDLALYPGISLDDNRRYDPREGTDSSIDDSDSSEPGYSSTVIQNTNPNIGKED